MPPWPYDRGWSSSGYARRVLMRGVYPLVASGWWLVLAAALTGCVSATDISRANLAVDATWQRGVDQVLDEHGTRRYGLPADKALHLFGRTLQRVGLKLEGRAPGSDIVLAVGVPPRPLTADEWESVKDIEEPRMQAAVKEAVGAGLASLYYLDTKSYLLVFGAKVTAISRSQSIITMRGELRYIGPYQGLYWPKSLPPLAAQLGAVKIWYEFERVLEEQGYETKPPAKEAPAVGA